MTERDQEESLKKTQDDIADEDDEYNEEDDEDYDPTKLNNSDDEGDSENDDPDDTTRAVNKEIKKAKYDSIDTGEGGLVKTRSQREQEGKEEKKHKIRKVSKSTSNLDINSIFAELNSQSLHGSSTATPTPDFHDSKVEANNTSSGQSSSKLMASTNGSDLEPKKVKIRRTYEFAGETITEEKFVDADSQEAKAHFNSVSIQEKKDSTKHGDPESTNHDKPKFVRPPHLRPPRKRRPGLLEAIINGTSNAKLSTLEKSRLDWATYVDKQKIGDELKIANKGGYLEKQDFLARVEAKKDQQYKDAKSQAAAIAANINGGSNANNSGI